MTLNPVFTPTLVRQAVRAAGDAYKEPLTHVAGESEGLLTNYGDGWHFGIQGTEFDGSGIIFGDMLIDGLAYPCKHPDLGWLHKGFLMGRLVPDWNRGGARGLFHASYADLVGLDAPYVIDGHSKAGAEAPIMGGLMTLAGYPPKAIVTVDAPKFAIGDQLAEVLKDVPVLHIRIRPSPINKVPLTPWWHHGPGDVLELGPPFKGLGDIRAHKIKRIAALVDAHFDN